MLLFTSITLAIAGHLHAIPTTMSQHSQENPIEDSIYVKRQEWHARPPLETKPLSTPVPYVVIHHSYIPPACKNLVECSYAMRAMQSMHIDQNKWWDIGYNFAVGSDGKAYEGRGFTILGAHAKHFNTHSIGICLIGNWNDTLPPSHQLEKTKALIQYGVDQGFIREDYKLVGHRQVRPTECPGQTLYDHISTWPHFDGTLDLATNFVEDEVKPKLIFSH
ncbi:peptidoglycan-recognition protein LB-like [Pectinophora gossypiella]|uniref:peptidoglycan-recognition protein LB-like n=1 Tax=Pectinophora gossypiella TaxID=13191 RepID=UPI00214EC62C|nr:peptidoglycan-recognition protein LB-like [Pectinophora gossypiella]